MSVTMRQNYVHKIQQLILGSEVNILIATGEKYAKLHIDLSRSDLF